MDVKYITVKTNKLPTIPIVDGQIIALSDKNAWMYDMEGTRKTVSGQLIVEALPEDTSTIYKDTIVIVSQGAGKGIYWWDGVQFTLASSINTDQNVLSEQTDIAKFFIVGSSEAGDATGTLKKSQQVYVDSATGKIRAEGFTGGKADAAIEADHATAADQATVDSKNQVITKTYIKSITTQGTTLTLTYGDGTTRTIETEDTDTHCVTNVVFTSDATGSINKVADNGQVRMNILDDADLRSSHQIVGTGTVEVTSDARGNVEINGKKFWQPNTATQEGYVPAGVPNKIWGTDEAGNPGWIENQEQYVHPKSGVNPGIYHQVEVNDQGHVVAASNPTTLEEYGITDAACYKILKGDESLNDIVDSGFYRALSGNTIGDKPDEVDGFGLLVIAEDETGRITQKIFTDVQRTRTGYGDLFEPWTIDMLTDTVYSHPSGPGFNHIPLAGEAGQILTWDSDGQARWEDPERVAVAPMEGATETKPGKAGTVPAPDAGPADSYLRCDGTWAKPDNTQYGDFVGTSGLLDGKQGLVPAPATTDKDKYLNASGEWVYVDLDAPRARWEKYPPEEG